MKFFRRRLRRRFLIGGLLILAGAASLPFARADRFAEGVRGALGQALDRQVEVAGAVRFHLLPGPGFSLASVVIHEKPEFGAEPIAYVETLHARLRLTSLLRGRLEFSHLALEEPSINLARHPDRGWNFVALIERGLGASRTRGDALPTIEVDAGRMNVRVGDTKSAFYFANADVVLSPGGEDNALAIRFSGSPARTDRPAHGFGRLTGRGRLFFPAESEGRLQISLHLERSALGEVLSLFEQSGLPVSGFVASRARLEGYVSNLSLSGELQLEGVHFGSVTDARPGAWDVAYSGNLDMRHQELVVETSPDQATPVAVRFRMSQWLTRPRWTMAAQLARAPVGVLTEAGRRVGILLPAKSRLTGEASGAFSYAPETGLQGAVLVEDAALELPPHPPVRFGTARLAYNTGRLTMDPADFQLGEIGSGSAEVRYVPATGSLDARLTADSIPVERFRELWKDLLGRSAAGVLEECRQGGWSGRLRFRQEAERREEWSGRINLKGTRIILPGVAEPVHIDSALVTLSGNRAVFSSLNGRVGQLSFEGEYREAKEDGEAAQLHLKFTRFDAALLERLLAPTLERRRGFLARTLRLGAAPLPAWLSGRRLDGMLQADQVTSLPFPAESMNLHFRWHGEEVEIPRLDLRAGGGQLTASGIVSLGGGQPDYRFALELAGAAFSGGRLNAETRLETSGTGDSLLANLRAEGTFAGRALLVGPAEEWRSAQGMFEFSITRGAPRYLLNSVEVNTGSEIYRGHGSSLPDGRLQLELAAADKQLKLAGTVLPLRLSALPAR